DVAKAQDVGARGRHWSGDIETLAVAEAEIICAGEAAERADQVGLIECRVAGRCLPGQCPGSDRPACKLGNATGLERERARDLDRAVDGERRRAIVEVEIAGGQ